MKAWSHSALKSFEQCPKRYYETSISKRYQDAGGEAMMWGSEVHKAFENYFKNGKPFPMGMKQFQPLAEQLKRSAEPKQVEEMTETKLALSQQLQPTSYFAKNVWVRGVVDYGIINGKKAAIFDWKTGKRKSDDDQLALMAGLMFAQDPELEYIVSTFVWLQEDPGQQMERLEFKREDVGEIWGRFFGRVEEFQKAFEKEDFPPRPNGLCRRYCPVASCPYHGT